MQGMKPETVPGRAEAIDGIVILDGPDGVAVSMTAYAARETGHQLIAAADQADQQVSDKAP